MQRDFMFLRDPKAYVEDTLREFVRDELERNPDLSVEEARQRVLDAVPELRAALAHLAADDEAAAEGSGSDTDRSSSDDAAWKRIGKTMLAYRKTHPNSSYAEAMQHARRQHPQYRHLLSGSGKAHMPEGWQ